MLNNWYNKYSVDLMNDLNSDPEESKYHPNHTSREVKSGHYVDVKPTLLPNPKLISYSHDLADNMNISNTLINSSQMIAFLSGNNEYIPKSWATPYALSIYGREMISNCPFGTGNGYGDGRAISIGNFNVNNKNYELQLKGGGKTPFARSGDGRAVLRSSVREFLTSEAMYHLGVPTTRALSLIVSETEKALRSSYKKRDGSVDENITAITCRVSDSFYRVGHLELFSRRTRKKNNQQELEELRLLFIHIVKREYPYLVKNMNNIEIRNNIDQLVIKFMRESGSKFSRLVSRWMSVGYVQSNMNSDNCSVGGRTIDYGPFGFMGIYDRDKNFWVDSGDHFAYMNQPNAMVKNYTTMCNSLKPLVNNKYKKEIEKIINEFPCKCSADLKQMWVEKLGFKSLSWKDGVNNLYCRLERLLQESVVDWTIFWRELSWYPIKKSDKYESEIHSVMFAFHNTNKFDKRWKQWIDDWLNLLKIEQKDAREITNYMLSKSPKYIPREYMLAEAYEKAKIGDYQLIKELSMLFTQPFTEQQDFEKWYKLPNKSDTNKAGIASMTCSS